MKLTIIGSGDAFGSGGRLNTCFRIEAAGRDLLLDCGASSLPALKSRNIDPSTINGVMLSHLHGDHFGGVVFLLMDGHSLGRRIRPLVIAGPPGTRERLNAALEVFFPRSTGIAWRYPWEVVEIAPRTPSKILGLSVETIEVIHQSGAPSTGVRLSDGHRVLAYSGDTEWTEALVSIAKNADLFIVEWLRAQPRRHWTHELDQAQGAARRSQCAKNHDHPYESVDAGERRGGARLGRTHCERRAGAGAMSARPAKPSACCRPDTSFSLAT